jgi:hypothetical protein
MASTVRALLTTADGRHRAERVRQAGWAHATAIGFDATEAVLRNAVHLIAAHGRGTARRSA